MCTTFTHVSHPTFPPPAHGSDVGFMFNTSSTTSFANPNITIDDPVGVQVVAD
jgi:hypothetical protein